jgi:Ca-activated chloride channel family protein
MRALRRTAIRHGDARNMICPRKNLLLALAVVAAFALAEAAPVPNARAQGAQTAPPPPPQTLPGEDPRGVIRARVDLVVVPVTVKDSSGALVDDLRDDEFRVLEDNVDQKIAFFSTDTFPLSAVILLDDGLKTKTAERVKQTLGTISGAFSEADEVAVGRFDAYYSPVLDFTTDNDKLLSALKGLDLGNQSFSTTNTGNGPTPPRPSAGDVIAPGGSIPTSSPFHPANTKHIDDALFAAGQMLKTRGRERRKIILIVSDGANARYNAHTSSETMKTLLSSDISVYAIGLDQAVLLRGTTDLSHYAHQTGGDVYYALHESDLPDLYAQTSEQARHQYTIGYIPTGTDRGKPYHSIEVRIRRSGLTLLCRDGYYLVPRQ